MKKLKFTTEEAAWISDVLQRRITFEEIHGIFSIKSHNYAKSALRKITDSLENFYKSWEMTLCAGCINEHLDYFLEKIKLSDAIDYLNISDEMKEACHLVDMSKDIFMKFGMHKTKSPLGYDFGFRYQQVFDSIEQLKLSDLVYLSGSVENGFYKIGLLYRSSQLAVFELENNIEGRDIQFFPIKTDPKSYQKNRFSLLTTRSKALPLLRSSRQNDWVVKQMIFFEKILN